MALKPPSIRFREPRPPAEGGHPGLRPGTTVRDGIRLDRDLGVPMRDGATIYVDLYRPAHPAADLPVLIAWGPYGKHGGPAARNNHSPASGIEPGWVSPLAAAEAPDPTYWCPHGYAVAYADPRGTWESPGEFTMSTAQEADDYHDLIEWAGTQPWSNGRVGLAGASYLAFSQWHVATTKPAHLAAICPFEGLSDLYREFAYHGGIPETGFRKVFTRHATGFAAPGARVEDLEALFAEHPLRDEYWQGKDVDLSDVHVPAYVVAGWDSHCLHTRGTLEAYKQLAGPAWLEAHGKKVWQQYYRPEAVERQRQFFDHTLKGEDNGWQDQPRVRIEVRTRGEEATVRTEAEWPPERTRYTPLYLDASASSLAPAPVEREAHVRYDARGGDEPPHASFDHVFAEDTEVTGHMKLRLWVEVDQGDDADLFVAVQKLDRAGRLVGFPHAALHDEGPVALGWLRASHRALDPLRSTPQQPWHPHTHEEPLRPGVPVALEIELWPSSTLFEAGEALRVRVQGSDIYRASTVLFTHEDTRNAGAHIVHAGGRYDSHLLVPVLPRRD